MAADTGLKLVHSAPPEDPDALLTQVARGDRAAYADLFDLLAPSVLGIARRVVRDPSLAEDVTQETFLEVWRNATRFDPDRGRAKTWVLTVAHRRAVDAVRRSESQRRNDGHAALDEIDHDAPEQAAIRADEHAEVRGCLDTLTELQLESVRLAYFQGYSYPEVAALLGKPLPTIKTRMRDGLIRLRDCLEGRA
ncbi:ECF RNA polymerase sigma factor SigK [Nocardioidaceae bacterium]|nr:ECF RNA polymerase sigma factor SigK [Nocardioidaceae bacterium]